MTWLCSSHLALRSSCATGCHKQTHGNNGQLLAGAQHESWENRMCSQFAGSRRSGGSVPACQRWKQIILPTTYAKLRIVQSCCHLGIILTKTGCITKETAKRCKAMLGACLPVTHRVFCLKGDLPQHQAAIGACSVGWHSLPWSCHVARIERGMFGSVGGGTLQGPAQDL